MTQSCDILRRFSTASCAGPCPWKSACRRTDREIYREPVRQPVHCPDLIFLFCFKRSLWHFGNWLRTVRTKDTKDPSTDSWRGVACLRLGFFSAAAPSTHVLKVAASGGGWGQEEVLVCLVILLLQFQLPALSANHDRKRFLCAQSYATVASSCSFSLSFCFALLLALHAPIEYRHTHNTHTHTHNLYIDTHTHKYSWFFVILECKRRSWSGSEEFALC